MTASLTAFAAEQQRTFDATTSPSVRKEQGHFGTPPAIAEFMASLSDCSSGFALRILDPGAGVGTLSAAFCQRVQQKYKNCRLEFELWENDAKLIPHLERTMAACRSSLREAGHEMEFIVRVDDFILANTQRTLFSTGRPACFNIALLNPPYFKLRKESPQAKAMEHVVHGQPNIYALFMALSADLVVPQGEMIAITPRSYFNGAYFKRFRKWLFDRMTVRQIHLFESRSEAFRDDAVLQENVILRAQKHGSRSPIMLTSSFGRDLENLRETQSDYDKVIDNSDGDHLIRIASGDMERQVVSAIDGLPNRFRDLGYEISTGPVVSFRSTEFLRNRMGAMTAPLLWMHNVRPFVTRNAESPGKPPHIEISEASKRLLVPARNYVLFKRFTAKEEKRRLVAGILTREDCYSDWVGLENHLNYIYRIGGELSTNEVFGLAAYFNSAFVDQYFRAISGNTQVNATEIRGMPMPDVETIVRIGRNVLRAGTKSLTEVESIVGRALRLPVSLLDSLMKVT